MVNLLKPCLLTSFLRLPPIKDPSEEVEASESLFDFVPSSESTSSVILLFSSFYCFLLGYFPSS